ncbi:MAG: competence/damage-inducible protein A [Thermoanaerobaculia bacterium]
MRAAIIAVGSEMLGISKLDTNSLEVTRYLEEWGVELARKSIIGDHAADLGSELRETLDGCDIVVVMGGLGPTEDDVTKDVVSGVLGVPMREDTEALARMVDLFEKRGYPMPDTNRKQALAFEGHGYLRNPRGTAPGFHLEIDWSGWKRHLWIFPGVPNELRGMLEADFGPWLQTLGLPRRHWRSLRIIGMPESLADQKLKAFYEKYRDTPVTILASRGELALHFYTLGSEDAAYAKLLEMEADVREALGERVYGTGEDTIELVIGRMLLARGETVATAESCTGGMLSTRITDVSGSSQWFRGGVVAYSGEVKMSMVGVDPANIQQHGEVSEEVARELATGARRRFGTTWGIGITGIAGPDGGSEAKPVGTVHIAVASPTGVEHRKLYFAGGRENVRRFATNAALDLLRKAIGSC